MPKLLPGLVVNAPQGSKADIAHAAEIDGFIIYT
jgi:hypothetical protein